MLAFWCGGDTEQIDRLFRQSGLYREKWERDDYRIGTLNKAVVYDRSKQKVQEKRWEYDEQGEPSSYTLYDYTEEEPEMFVTVYEREYDVHGNWVKCTEFEVLGDRKLPTYTTVRTIEYF